MLERRQAPTMVSLGSLIHAGRLATEALWAHPDDSVGRGQVEELVARVRMEANYLGLSEMLVVCDEIGPIANAAPTPQAVEILINGFERLARHWRAAQTK